VKAEIVVDGAPLPAGDRASVNASAPAIALKQRLSRRIQGYVESLGFGEQVSPAKLTWAIMSEPGIADVRNLTLIRYPSPPNRSSISDGIDAAVAEELGCGVSFKPEPDSVAVYIDDIDDLWII